MIFEINLLAGKTLVLYHKFIEVIRLAPRIMTDFLCLEHREKIKNFLNEYVYRTVFETQDFALPSEENIGEEHHTFATSKRANQGTANEAATRNGLRIIDISQGAQNPDGST
jgi:hypothetical protein